MMTYRGKEEKENREKRKENEKTYISETECNDVTGERVTTSMHEICSGYQNYSATCAQDFFRSISLR